MEWTCEKNRNFATMKTKRKTDENLVSLGNRTTEEQREIAQKGGIASGEARREKKTMRELLEAAFAIAMKDKDGQSIKSPDTGKELTRKEAAMIKLALKASTGDIKAIETAAKLLGEGETKVVVETTSPAEKLAALINEARKK